MPPTAKQKVVRSAFKKSCDCFNRQVDAGGATPPVAGPRNKSWWHTDSLPSGLRYYNYFMHKTELLYLADTIPDWCVEPPPGDSWVRESTPDGNYGGQDVLYVSKRDIAGAIDRHRWSFIERADDGANLHILVNSCKNICTIEYYACGEAWVEDVITWNNKPALGGLIGTLEIPEIIGDEPADERRFVFGGIASNSVVLVPQDKPGEDWEVNVSFASKEDANPEDRPYWG